MRLVKEFNGQIKSVEYENEIALCIEIRQGLIPFFLDKPIQGLKIQHLETLN